MKKLVSLLLVLTLVLGLATVAFAEGEATVLTPVNNEGTWAVNYSAAGTYSLTLPEGCTSVNVDCYAPYGMMNYAINISSTNASGVNNDYGVTYGMNPNPYSPDMGGNYSFAIDFQNYGSFVLTGEAGDVFTISVVAPPIGTFNTRDDFVIDSFYYEENANSKAIQTGDYSYEFELVPPADDTYYGEYYYGVQAYDGPYYVTISDVTVDLLPNTAVEGATLEWSVAYNTMYGNAEVSSEDPDVTSATTGMEYEGYYTLTVKAGQYDENGMLVGPAHVKFTLSYEYAEPGSEVNPYGESFNETPDIFRTTSIPASKLVEDNYYGLDYIYYDIFNNLSSGGKLIIDDADAVIKYDGEFYTAANDDDNDDSVLTVELAWDSYQWTVGIANVGDDTKRFDVECDLLDGNRDNPVDLVIGENKVSFDMQYSEAYYYNYYFYEWTATEAGVISISDLTATIPEDLLENYPEDAEVTAEYAWALNIETAEEDPTIEGDSVTVAEGDVITVWVGVVYDEDMWVCPDAEVTFTASFMTEAEANPIRVNAATDLTGIDVPAGETVYYAINSHLNGQILTVMVDENAVVTLNGTELKAENGVVSAELTGTPINKLVVTNNGDKAASYVATINWPVGSESNPIEIKNSNELSGLDVPAGESTYVAINSQLNGQILTIAVDANTVVTLNGKEVKAENGVVSVELTGTPVNTLVVTNNGEKDASYTASVAYALGTAGNPIVITTEKELNATEVAAGTEVHYLLNSKLDGAVLSVKGDKAYVIVDGVKTEAKDGVIKLTLTAKAATISLVVGNNGDKAATVTLGYSDNPNTGDAGVLAPVVSLLMSAMSTVALVIKKKEF